MHLPSERIEWLSGWLREHPEGVSIGPAAIIDLCKVLDLTAVDIRSLEDQVATTRAAIAAARRRDNVVRFPVIPRPIPTEESA